MATTDFQFGELQQRAAMLTPIRTVPAQSRPAAPPGGDSDLSRSVDNTLADSFPASDPPSWTASVATPAPARRVAPRTGNAGTLRRTLQRVAALF